MKNDDADSDGGGAAMARLKRLWRGWRWLGGVCEVNPGFAESMGLLHGRGLTGDDGTDADADPGRGDSDAARPCCTPTAGRGTTATRR